MKRIAIAFLLIFYGSSVFSQNLKFDEKKYHWEGGLYAGFNSDGYELDAGIAYYVNRFLGVRCGVGWASQIGKIDGLINWIYPDDIQDWQYDDYDDDTITRFRFTPALSLRSPCILDWKSQGVQLYAFAEPGLVFATPAPDSHKARWLTGMLRAGLNMQVDRWVITLGYGISDFSLTSGLKHYDEPDHITHTVFIGSSYKF